jgi:hypothetical protein
MAEKTWDEILAEEAIADEIERLHEQADEDAAVKFIKLSDIGKDAGNKPLQIIGLMNAAAVVCKLGDYDFCFKIIDSANTVDEEICTEYLQEQPRMHEMMKILSEAGVLNN